MSVDWKWTQQYAFLHMAWTRAMEQGRFADADAIRQEMAPCV